MNNFAVVFLFIIIVYLFVYYNMIRYIYLHFGSTDKILRKYPSLKKNTSNKVIVSFTTSSISKIKKMYPMIYSIFDQTVQVDQIVMNVPHSFKSKTLTELSKIIFVKKCAIDYGNGNKCIPTVTREKDYGTIIILLKDNMIYGKDFLEMIILESMKYPNKVIMSNGGILTKPEFFSKEILNVNCKINDEEIIKKYTKVDVRVMEYNHNIARL